MESVGKIRFLFAFQEFVLGKHLLVETILLQGLPIVRISLLASMTRKRQVRCVAQVGSIRSKVVSSSPQKTKQEQSRRSHSSRYRNECR